MKYLLPLLLTGLFFISAYGQEVKENKIVKVKQGSISNSNDFVYDAANDEYAYIETVDTVKSTSRIVSSKGDSKVYEEILSVNILFDNKGNYYAVCGNNTDKESADYSFIKNGKEILKLNSFKGPLIFKNKVIYFAGGKNSKECIYKYDTETGNISHEKEYKYIKLPYPMDEYMDMYNIGIPFTKNNIMYYIAGADDGEMVVTGKSEGKKYPQIDPGTFKEDEKGNIAYMATQSADEYLMKYLIYKGTEYTSDDDLGRFYDFDRTTGLPVYTTSKKINDSTYIESCWRGNDKLGTYNGQIYDILVSPNGKICFTISDNSAENYTSHVVIDGNKSGGYFSAYNLLCTKDNDVFYIAAADTNKYFIMKNDRKISDDFYYISYLKILPDGSCIYTAAPEASNADFINKSYVFINDKRYGPFSTFVYENYFDPYQFTSGESGEYAFDVMESESSGDDNYVKCSLITNKWTAFDIGFVSNKQYYKGDLYFNTWKISNPEDIGFYKVYKNRTPLTEKYDTLINYNFDKDKKLISFTGLRKNVYYYVTINF